MNVEIGADAAQFPEKEYINGIIAFAVKVTSTLSHFTTRENRLREEKWGLGW
jgi:hypothetical protein